MEDSQTRKIKRYRCWKKPMNNWNWSWTDQQSRECETSDREFEKARKKLFE